MDLHNSITIDDSQQKLALTWYINFEIETIVLFVIFASHVLAFLLAWLFFEGSKLLNNRRP